MGNTMIMLKRPAEFTAPAVFDGCRVLTFTREHKSGDFSMVYWIFPAESNPEEIVKTLGALGVNVEGSHSTSAYDCTGKWYCSPVRTRICPRMILASQSWHLDV